MVDLPRTPLDNSVTQGPQSSVSGGEIRSAFGELAASMDALGQTFEDAAVEQAGLEGQGAVYKDEKGNLKYDAKNPLSRANKAFNRSAQTAFVSQISMDARPAIANLEVEAKGNVGEFDKLSSAYVREMLKGKDPLLRGVIQSELTGLITSSRTGMIRSQQQRDIQSQSDSIKARINMANEDAAALARTGGTNTAEYAEQLDIIRTLEKEKVGNPLFAYSQAESDVYLQGVESAHLAESIVGQVETIYHGPGGLPAATKFANTAFNDPELQLSPGERSKYRNAALGALKQFKADVAAEKAEARYDAKILREELENGASVRPEDIHAVADRLSKAGDFVGAMELNRRAIRAEQKGWFKEGTDDQRVAMFERVRGGGDDAALLIKQFEGFRGNPYFDVTAMRAGYGSDTVTRVGGIVEPVGPGTKVSRADAERDLTRRIGNFQAAAREKVGGPEWDGLSKATKAALTSVAYNYGSLPDRVVAAIRTGDNERIALAVEGLSGDNEGVNADRRSQEASIIRGGLGIGIDPKVYKDMQADIDSAGEKLFKSMQAGFLKTDPYSQDDLNRLGHYVGLSSNPQWKENVVKYIKETGNYSSQNMAEMEKTMSASAKNATSIFDQEMLDDMRTVHDKQAGMLKSDPLEMGRRIGMEGVKDIEPLNFADPVALGTGLAKNIAAARLVAQKYGSSTVGMLTKNDAAQFKSLVATSDVKQSAIAMQALAEVPDDLLRGTLEMPDVKEALIGASQSRDFDKYGAAMTTMDKLYNRAPQELARIFEKDAVDALQDWQGRLRYYNPLELEQEFKRRGDPQYASQQEKLRTAGSAKAREVTAITIASDLGGPVPTDSLIATAMSADFERQFSQRYASTQNAQTAHSQAIERLKQHWGPSVTNNGELMLHPPDHYYPPIEGSYDWINDQLNDDLVKAGFAHEVESSALALSGLSIIPRLLMEKPKVTKAWPHMLIADAVTESDAAAGKPPSYRVVVTDPNTGYSDFATDADGKELSIRFDSAPALAGAGLKYSEQRKRYLDAKPLFGAGGGW